MTLQFNADEIFEIAERIELNGGKFYRAAAEKFKGSRATEVLNDLAQMEEEHRITFAAMRADLSDEEGENTILDADDETKQYLAAIADGKVFNVDADATSLLSGKKTVQEIIHMAMGFEKDSIIFYLGMKDLVPEKLGKDKISNIIKEEKGHIVILNELLKSL